MVTSNYKTPINFYAALPLLFVFSLASCIPQSGSNKNSEDKDEAGTPIARVYLKRGSNPASQFFLQVAADPKMENLLICDQRVNGEKQCSRNVPGYQILKNMNEKIGDKNLYVTPNPLFLSEQSLVFLYYFNKQQNKYILNRQIGINDMFWRDIQPVLHKNCYMARCHASGDSFFGNITNRALNRKDFAGTAEQFKDLATMQAVFNIVMGNGSGRHPEFKFDEPAQKTQVLNYLKMLNTDFKIP